MTDIDHALSQLSFIQERMAASTRFRGFAPHAIAGTGLLAMATALAQSEWPLVHGQSDFGFILTWTMVAALAAVMVGTEALSRARRLHGRMADAMIGGTLRLLLPFGAAGAAITIVLLAEAPETMWILPGLWQMLVALIGFASIGSLPRTIVWSGAWYFVCGTAVLLLAARTQVLDPWMMGLPFGLGQFLTAAILRHAAGDGDG